MDIEVEYSISGGGTLHIDSDDVAKYGSVKNAVSKIVQETIGIKHDGMSPNSFLKIHDVRFEDWR